MMLPLPDDRLILGVKGSVSEYELSLFRQRSQEAIVAKAKRGALTFTLPAGLSWTPDGQIELHPDRRVQQAIRMVLDKLSEFGSVQVGKLPGNSQERAPNQANRG
jgi:DNA invertase Pin-like site-specific DNA recombinase